ncbi:hypothetical protein B1778_00825 [Dehalococcoides mccartyi]|uniref:DUF192 domain-containing protein n=1 Tax=Dehalococcoides mccartyi TaxID=61435 RepID=UPI00098F976B|nr:DUF192 domain-containing protein [Dehalococcoides mccartyi]AQU05316.1 hypothetical protein B1777_00970 [Dehalococcoides mccartyi]AQU06769.1 hypothetical protein B1778_00825 [Dehalococcoides mccartyi]
MAGPAVVRIKDREWLVSLAVTPWEMAQGLGGLPELPPGTGMLFDLAIEQTIQVTTVPMLFPLDIAFLSEDLTIIEVYRNVEPGYLVTSIQPARYFIEVNAGELEGIAPGEIASVEFLPFEEIPVVTDWLSMMFSLAGFLVLGTLTVSIVRDFTKKAFEEPEKKPALLPQVSSRKSTAGYELETDRMGNTIITRSDDPKKGVFLQFESDKTLVYDLLKKGEKKDLDVGWKIKIRRSEPRASILDALWESSAQPRKVPQTVKKPTRYDVKVETWQERDRLGIWLTDRRTDKVIAEWWDENAREMFEQGFFKPGMIRQQAITGRDFEKSVMAYAESVGILTPTISPAVQPRSSGDTPVADLVEKWGKAKRNSALALKDLEAISQRYDITDCKEALLEYRDIDRSDYSYSEEYQEARDEAWEAFIESLESLSGEEETEGDEKDERETSGKARAVIPEHHRKLESKGGLEFLPDSPEFLAYTIDDIGYRDRIDSAFLNAITRARGNRS